MQMRTNSNAHQFKKNTKQFKFNPIQFQIQNSKFKFKQGGIDAAIARALAYAPYADLLWFETSDPSMEEAEVRDFEIRNSIFFSK